MDNHPHPIVTSKVAFLLGAGASAAFGYPTMGTLTEEFWREIRSRKDYASRTEPFLRQWGIEPLKEDIETVLEQLTVIRSLRGGGYRDDRELAAELRRLAVETIRSAIAGVGVDIVRIEEHYRLLFDSVDQTTIPIFTTNYDSVLEEFAEKCKLEIIDGFFTPPTRKVKWSSARFHSFRESNHTKRILLFKLHGSLDWYRDNNSGETFSLSSEPMCEELEQVALYPAETKLIFQDPYFTCYRFFDECIRHAKLLVVIGCALRDEALKERLYNGLENNPHLKLLWFLDEEKSVTFQNWSTNARSHPFGAETKKIVSVIKEHLRQIDAPETADTSVLDMREIVLEQSKVPFSAGQGADFVLIDSSSSTGFTLEIEIPEGAPYWRAGFVLAPEPYIKEGDAFRSIAEYFLFHVGRGNWDDPEHMEEKFLWLACLRGLRCRDLVMFSWDERNLVIDVNFDRGVESRAALEFANRKEQFVIDSNYFRHLYLLAWADGLSPFSVKMRLQLKKG